MAKIDITVDTEEPSCTVTIDGETIENVTDVSIYKSYDSKNYGLSITTREKMDNGVNKSMVYYSYGTDKAKEYLEKGVAKASKIDGFVVVEKEVEDLFRDVLDYFKPDSQ